MLFEGPHLDHELGPREDGLRRRAAGGVPVQHLVHQVGEGRAHDSLRQGELHVLRHFLLRDRARVIGCQEVLRR